MLKRLIAKKGELIRCMIDCPVVGLREFGRKLKKGDVVRTPADCYNGIAYEKVAVISKETVIYEPKN